MARRLAPDGGPLSQIMMKQPPTKTLNVIRLEDEAQCVINADDFDADLFDIIEKAKPKAVTRTDEVETEPAPTFDPRRFGRQDREDLAVMTKESLTAMEEWKATTEEEQRVSTKKAQVIDLILDVRERNA